MTWVFTFEKSIKLYMGDVSAYCVQVTAPVYKNQEAWKVVLNELIKGQSACNGQRIREWVGGGWGGRLDLVPGPCKEF